MDKSPVTSSSSTSIYHTDIESALARLSAVKKGYLSDAYIHKIIPEDALSNFQFKLPIFNRGTYARASVFDRVIRAFLSCNSSAHCQIVNLGCGWDTQWLRLHEEEIAPLSFFEVDFPEIISAKLERLKADIDSKCSATNAAKHRIFTTFILGYVPITGDLNYFVERIVPSLMREGFDPSLPTLILTEVVLIYLGKTPTLDIFNWFSSTLKPASESKNSTSTCDKREAFGTTFQHGHSYFVTLDPSSFSDPFGMMMIKNLESSSIYLVNELLLSGRPAFEDAMGLINWKLLNSFTLGKAYEKYISSEEKKRISSLEWVDELEEWDLLSSHYYFSIFQLNCISK